MFTPAAFRWDDEAAALDLVSRFNFGALLTVDGAAPFVTHLPFLVDSTRRVLKGHVATANPHARNLDGRDCLALFMGPHAYVSPDWYGPQGTDVPTWNYVAVHVAGRLRVVTEAEQIDKMLSELAAHEEMRRADLESGGQIWSMEKVQPEDLARMRRGIVAFEIDITQITAKRKLSQNKPRDVAVRVAEKLAAVGAADLAREMSKARD